MQGRDTDVSGFEEKSKCYTKDQDSVENWVSQNTVNQDSLVKCLHYFKEKLFKIWNVCLVNTQHNEKENFEKFS